MKFRSIVLVSLVALGTSVQASNELINKPVLSASPKHYDMQDLKLWLFGYPQVQLTLNDGIATIAGHVDSPIEVSHIVKQVEKTAGVRRVTNLINAD